MAKKQSPEEIKEAENATPPKQLDVVVINPCLKYTSQSRIQEWMAIEAATILKELDQQGLPIEELWQVHKQKFRLV